MFSRRFVIPLLVLASALTSSAAPPRVLPWDGVQSINDGWTYFESDSAAPPAGFASAESVTLPHSWNAKDTLETREYRRGASWYVRDLDIPAAILAGRQRVFLRCGAAGQTAEVFLNGAHLGGHVGGYTAFTFELTPHLAADGNRIAIRVSNAHDTLRAPLSGDFNQYGGLYRGVTLITAPEVGFSRDENGGPGVRVWSPQVSEKQAGTRIETVLSNGSREVFSGTVLAELTAPDGQTAARAEQVIRIAAGEKSTASITLPVVNAPKLWTPESPNLYSLRITLVRDRTPVDEVRVRHGFRWFRFTPDDGFFLNGKAYRLIGMNRHQDHEGLGNALPDEQHDADLLAIKELGVNYLRPAHYPQDDYLLQRCDELGLLVQEEIPYVNQSTFEPAFEENLRTMMKEMIAQHFNHPCIILWGMGNEVGMKDRGDGKARCYDLVSRLNALVHALDPTRKTLFVTSFTDVPSKLGVLDIPDVIGYNLYQGWYRDNITDFKPFATRRHQLNPDKPFIVTEFGAGSDRRLHSSDPKRYDYTEEYQVEYLEGYLDQMEEMPWLAGFNWWAFADFGSAGRRNSIPHVNQKGLVTFSREPKDVFFLWKSRFSKEPVLHIQSAAWAERDGPAETSGRVITNLPAVEFVFNGKSLGTQARDFRWPYTMAKGPNTLLARGRDATGRMHEHRVSFNYVGLWKRLPVKASDHTANPAENLVDRSADTYWSAPAPAWAEVDLGTPSLIDGVEIEPYLGDKRTYGIKVSGRVKTGDSWETLWSGETESGKVFRIPQDRQLEWRFIRIDGRGNSENSDVALNELRVRTTTKKKNKDLYERLGAGEAGGLN